WNQQGKELQTLKGHEETVNGVALSPDGQMIATASGDNTVKLWNHRGRSCRLSKAMRSRSMV
ncbi:WD40 repeat domain-containing protein, partial [Okeania sp. SIO3I5]|uniref:WD40 repeat domain-containing protein n=1 Tax=Okeania sp. SIO3I5 TaxID=2607805 RepID=UPI0025F01FF6